MATALSRILLLACTLCMADAVYSHPGEDEQLARLGQYIAAQPDAQVLYIRRASLYSLGGHFEEAAADLTRAEALGPPAEAALERGLLHLRMGDAQLALSYFNRFLDAHPDAVYAYEYRAHAARAAGDKPRAVADLKRYIELQDNPHPGVYLAAADLLHEMRDTEQAIVLLDQGLAKIGLVTTLQRRAIELVLAQGRTAEAIFRLETLRKPLRENPRWKLEMAELLLQDQRIDDAQTLLADIELDLRARRATPANLAMLEHSQELRQKITATLQSNAH